MYRVCDDRDETINHMISECIKLAQKKYRTTHDWVGKVIHMELYKRLKFNHTNKCYVHKPYYVQWNEMHKVLEDFKIETRQSNISWLANGQIHK